MSCVHPLVPHVVVAGAQLGDVLVGLADWAARVVEPAGYVERRDDLVDVVLGEAARNVGYVVGDSQGGGTSM